MQRADRVRRFLLASARLADPALAGATARVGLDDPADLAVLYVADGAALRAATADVPSITDDRPRLEFSAPAASIAIPPGAETMAKVTASPSASVAAA